MPKIALGGALPLPLAALPGGVSAPAPAERTAFTPRPQEKRTLATPAALEADVDDPRDRRDYDVPLPNQSGWRYLRAGGNAMVTNYLVWQQNWFTGRDYVFLTRRDLTRNLRQGFEWDKDPIQTNFFGHPYHGSFYFNGARAAGLSFWESIPVALGGSLTWELFGETERPSMNDVFATTLGGVILGEMLHRLSSQVLDDSQSSWPRLARELLAAGISPLRGLDRLYTGTAWRNGLPPIRRDFSVAVHVGLDHQRSVPDSAPGSLAGQPGGNAGLLAVNIRYGSAVATRTDGTIGPFDVFNLYAATNVSAAKGFQGVQVFADGILHGWNSNITGDTGKLQDNNIFGFSQTYDYQGINDINLSGIGFGPANLTVFRSRKGYWLRLASTLQWVPIMGVTSSDTARTERDYNLAVGAAFGTTIEWSVGRFGRVGMRQRQYLGGVVSGEAGLEIAGYTRFWYEVDLVPELLGLGVAPTVLTRNGRYQTGNRFEGSVDSVQVYLNLHTGN